jgi:deaminated glutathione amidase
MKVAAIQMVSGISLDANLSEALRLLRQAARPAPNWPCCPSTSASWATRTKTSWCWPKRRAWARCRTFCPTPRATSSCGSWAAPCPWPPTTRTRRQRLAGLQPQRQAVSRYDKIHLFRYDNGRERYDEAAVLRAGDTPTTFD